MDVSALKTNQSFQTDSDTLVSVDNLSGGESTSQLVSYTYNEWTDNVPTLSTVSKYVADASNYLVKGVYFKTMQKFKLRRIIIKLWK